MAGDEWKSVNRRTALGHAMDLATTLISNNIDIGNATDEILESAKRFEKFLNGETTE